MLSSARGKAWQSNRRNRLKIPEGSGKGISQAVAGVVWAMQSTAGAMICRRAPSAHLVFTGKCTQVAAPAVARELSRFIWGAMVGKVA